MILSAAAAWVTGGLWPDPARRALALNPNDQALDEWFLAHATRLYTGDFRLVTPLLNAPEGVNLMCNASLIALGALLAPVTLLFGAPVTFAVVMTANLAATGIGWYLLFARTLRLHRIGAALGAAFTAFAPGMVAQANAHVHMTAAWLVPAVVWCVIRLVRLADEPDPAPRRRRAIRLGVLLGAIITVHLFLGEEMLFLTALTLACYCLVFAVLDRRAARRALPTLAAGLGVAAALSGSLLAYPLWVQFAGPQSVPNGPFEPTVFSADLLALVSISPLSLAGDEDARRLVSGPAEYTSFFGPPLLLIAAGTVLWLWRRPHVLASGVVAVLMCALALGPRVTVDGRRTEQIGLFALLSHLPVVDSALPTRFALAAVPLLALILATAVHVAITQTETLKVLVPVAVVAALVPLAPPPLPVAERAAVPRFFTEGYWRSCVRDNGVLVPVPLPDGADPDTMRWAAAANVGFGTPQGWFIGPYAQGGRASVGIYPRPTADLLSRVAASGLAARVGDTERATAARDVAFWRASCVVLAAHEHEAALKTTVEGLFGPPERIADVWAWRVGR